MKFHEFSEFISGYLILKSGSTGLHMRRFKMVTIRVLATVGGAGRYRPALRISARLLGSNWMRRPAQIELKFAEYVPIRSYFKLAKS